MWYDDYYDWYKTHAQIKAERKNEALITDLHGMRDRFCGIGTRRVKLVLNKLIASGDEIANLYRLALETEDVNITAKDSYGKYKKKRYDTKEALLKELYEAAKPLLDDDCYGRHNESTYSTSEIIFFELPNCEQISWHTNAYFVHGIKCYNTPWDEKVNSTLYKLQYAISERYRDEIMASAKRAKIDISETLDKIIEDGRVSYEKFRLWKAFDAEKRRRVFHELESMVENGHTAFIIDRLQGIFFPGTGLSYMVKSVNGNPMIEVTSGSNGTKIRLSKDDMQKGILSFLKIDSLPMFFSGKSKNFKVSDVLSAVMDTVGEDYCECSYDGNLTIKIVNGNRSIQTSKENGDTFFSLYKKVLNRVMQFDHYYKQMLQKEKKRQEKLEKKRNKKKNKNKQN